MELVVGGAELVALCHSRVALRNEQLFVRPLGKKFGRQSVQIIQAIRSNKVVVS